jgi:hypothetical protein
MQTSRAVFAAPWLRKMGVRKSYPRVGPLRSTPGVTTLVKFGPVFAVMADAHLQALRPLILATPSLANGQGVAC